VTLGIAAGFGVGITYFFISRHWITQSEVTLQRERIRRLTMEKEMAETHLKFLQAQIEPHFLFNTLSTVISLLETDPAQAAMMLSDFTHFLRVSLERTRQPETTLGQEFDIICAYLNLFKVRMGSRLTYRIMMPDELRSEAFSPMLLQPLVENAVQHGLEPLVDGGDIVVGAKRLDRHLTIWVADTGTGLQHRDGERRGFGLTNIAERLKTVYGKNARLLLEDNQPRGLKATIEVHL
jgi:LytS/YehU family sensor histidine kinase